VCALELMEELIELFQSKFGVDCLTFVTLIQEVHLEVNEALAIGLDE